MPIGAAIGVRGAARCPIIRRAAALSAGTDGAIAAVQRVCVESTHQQRTTTASKPLNGSCFLLFVVNFFSRPFHLLVSTRSWSRVKEESSTHPTTANRTRCHLVRGEKERGGEKKRKRSTKGEEPLRNPSQKNSRERE